MYTNMDNNINNNFYFIITWMIYFCSTITIAFFILSITFLMEYFLSEINTENFKGNIEKMILVNLILGLTTLFFTVIFYYIKKYRLTRNYS